MGAAPCPPPCRPAPPPISQNLIGTLNLATKRAARLAQTRGYWNGGSFDSSNPVRRGLHLDILKLTERGSRKGVERLRQTLTLLGANDEIDPTFN